MSADYRRLVAKGRMIDLIDALTREDYYRAHFDVDTGRIEFRCLKCQGPRDSIHGHAAVVEAGEAVFWECVSCRHRGTRFELEHLVLTDAGALDALLELVGVTT